MSLENPINSKLENPLSFEELMVLIQDGKYNQANFQPLTICHLSRSENQEDSQAEIAKTLKTENPTIEEKYLRSGSNNVWKVLTKKRILVKIDKKQVLNVNLTENQKTQLQNLCHEVLKRDRA